MKKRIIAGGVVVLLGGLLSGRVEHYSVRHEDILSVARYARLRVFGIPVFRSTVSVDSGFAKEYKDLFGIDPNSRHLRVFPPDFINSIGLRIYRSCGVSFESMQRREIVGRIYDLYRSGRSRAETKQSLSVINSLLPPDSTRGEWDLNRIDALRTSIGLSPIIPRELRTTKTNQRLQANGSSSP